MLNAVIIGSYYNYYIALILKPFSRFYSFTGNKVAVVAGHWTSTDRLLLDKHMQIL